MKPVRLTFNKITIDAGVILEWIIKFVFVLFLYFAMYSRYFGLFGLSGGMTASLLSAVIFILSIVYLFYRRGKIVISQLAAFITLFLVLLGLSSVIPSFVYDANPSVALLFSAEVVVVTFIFLSTYNFIRTGVIPPKFFLYAIATLGLIATIQALSTIIGEIVVGRLRSIGGVNYLGNTFAMSAVVWIMILYSHTFSSDSKKSQALIKFICFILVFLGMLLTGTRSATVAFFVGVILLQFFGIKNKNFKKNVLISLLVLIIVMAVFALYFDFSRILDRYTMDEVMRMAEIRFTYYARSVTDLSLLEFFTGRPDLYIFHEGQLGSSRYVNTHNLFLSLIRFHGIQTFVLFVLLLFVIVVRYLNVYFAHKAQPLYRFNESSSFVLLIMALVYTMFSGGRPTRAFSLFIMMGYLAGYLELLKTVHSPEEYKKLIL